jgi:hypothetical protein
MDMSSLTKAALAGFLASIAAPAAMATDYDGSKPLICAALEGVSCRANVECKSGTAATLGLPQFFWFDAAAKTVAEKGPDGQTRSSTIQTVTQGPSYMILQGSKDNLGWSGTISKVSGKLTLTGSDGAAALTVFGACAPTK